MALVTFIGDPRKGGDGPSVMRLYDGVFPKGEAVEYAGPGLAKLRGNDHFRVVDGEPAVDAWAVDAKPMRKKPGRKPKAVEPSPE